MNKISLNVLHKLHETLHIKHGDLKDELNEQYMSLMYINPYDIVLEIGGNIGRNSLIISSILNDSKQLTVIECNDEYCKQLQENKELNNFNFDIVCGAISKTPLYQVGWNCYNNKRINSTMVNILDYKDIIHKDYNVLVIDCEGAFYYIIKDYPEILNGIDKIIIENDYDCVEHYHYVEDVLYSLDFQPVYVNNLIGINMPCKDFFYQVYLRDIERGIEEYILY